MSLLMPDNCGDVLVTVITAPSDRTGRGVFRPCQALLKFGFLDEQRN
jgi:hypothetical protein